MLTTEDIPQHRSGRLHFCVVKDTSHIADIIDLARIAHDESRFAHIPFAPDKVRKSVLDALDTPRQKGVFLARRSETPVGFAGCSVGEYQIGTDVLIATIHNLNVRKEVRSMLNGGKVALGLFKGMETWARARNAHELLFHVTSGTDLPRTHKLVKRTGYTLIGGNYAKTL